MRVGCGNSPDGCSSSRVTAPPKCIIYRRPAKGMLHEYTPLSTRLVAGIHYITLGWNVVGTVIVLSAALAAHSVALAGFGLDSLIEIVASLVVVWQLKGVNQHREHTALRVIGGAFALLALYSTGPIHSYAANPGPTRHILCRHYLARRDPNSDAVVSVGETSDRHSTRQRSSADRRARHTDRCLLGGRCLSRFNLKYAVGLVVADPLAGLVIVYYGFKEAWDIWQEERPYSANTRH